MIYSGSVLPNSGEDYKGVGLELVGASGSLKFRTIHQYLMYKQIHFL